MTRVLIGAHDDDLARCARARSRRPQLASGLPPELRSLIRHWLPFWSEWRWSGTGLEMVGVALMGIRDDHVAWARKGGRGAASGLVVGFRPGDARYARSCTSNTLDIR